MINLSVVSRLDCCTTAHLTNMCDPCKLLVENSIKAACGVCHGTLLRRVRAIIAVHLQAPAAPSGTLGVLLTLVEGGRGGANSGTRALSTCSQLMW